jgi:mono/diheme cytochrome c family protein
VLPYRKEKSNDESQPRRPANRAPALGAPTDCPAPRADRADRAGRRRGCLPVPSPTATTAPKPSEPTKAPGGPTAAPAPAAVTAGSLADAGKGVFASKCGGCHGANGQGGAGPASIGSSNALAKYATAKGLYDKVSTTMPRSAPGSLSVAEYLQVTAFLLVQNNFVKAADPLDAATLAAILIK